MNKNPIFEGLKKYTAQLESRLDLLEAELGYLNSLFTAVGFPTGLEAVKGAAEELLAEGKIELL